MVCDPVLLFDKNGWGKMLDLPKGPQDLYVFCYFIGTDDKKKQQVLNYCEKKKFRVHYLRYVNGYSAFDSKIRENKRLKVLKTLSPRQFVEEIAGASLLFTDSFHGMCFALIEHTPFYIIERSDMGIAINMSSRIDEVLGRLGLAGRKKNLSEIYEDEMKLEIDWKMVEHELEKYRDYSERFLQSALREDAQNVRS